MSELRQTVVLCTRVGDWIEPGTTEAQLMPLLQDAGYAVQMTRTPSGLLAALDAADAPAIVVLDWRVLELHVPEDLYCAEAYNLFWELQHALEERRGSKHAGVIAIIYRQVSAAGGFGLPWAVTSDMYLRYPFHPQEFLQFVRRLLTNPQWERRALRDDRLL